MNLNASKIYTSLLLATFLLCFSCNQNAQQNEVIKEKEIVLVPNKTIPNKEITDKAYRLDTLFTKLYNNNEFNGNVLIAQYGNIIYQKSFGVADANAKINLSDSSQFQLASVSKTLTAALILKLAEKNILQLEANVKNYIPNFPYEKISVKTLLCHRSGLPNYIYFCNDYIKNNNVKKLTIEEVLNIMIEQKPPINFQANARFNYCNTNYILLAHIAELATKTSFSKLMQQYIFEPTGMKKTCFVTDLDSNKSNQVTKGYSFKMSEISNDAFDNVLGDKGVYSTTKDMFLFTEAYFNGKLLDTTLLLKAIEPYSPERKLVNYGYGWRMKFYTDKATKLVFHNGWWHGYRTALQRRMKDNTTIIILSNRLNKSVYHTQRMFNALDGVIPAKTETGEEEE